LHTRESERSLAEITILDFHFRDYRLELCIFSESRRLKRVFLYT